MPISNNSVVIDSNQREIPLENLINNTNTKLDSVINNAEIAIFRERQIENGGCYQIIGRQAIGGSATVDIILDPTALTGKNLYLEIPSFSAGDVTVFVNQYANPTASDNGTLVNFINCNGLSTNTASTILRINPTVTDVGILGAEPVIFATKFSTGGQITSALAKVLPSIKYLIRLVNQNATASTMAYTFLIYETTDTLS